MVNYFQNLTRLDIHLFEDLDYIKDIYIPLFIAFLGPLFVAIKFLYDKWDYKKRETKILKKKIKLEKLNNKIKKFYWPLYILLLKDFDLWSKIKFKFDNYYITHSDSESDINESNLDIPEQNRCKFVKNNVTCSNFVAKNCIDRYGAYCIKHQPFKYLKILKTCEMEIKNNYNNDIIKKKNTKELINYKNIIKNNVVIDVNEIKNNPFNKNIINKVNNLSKLKNIPKNNIKNTPKNSIKNNISNVPGNITGNEVGNIDSIINNTNLNMLTGRNQFSQFEI